MFRPEKAAQMTTPCKLNTFITSNKNCVSKKMFNENSSKDVTFFCNFSSYGTTEREINGLYVAEENITVTTWYNPDIVAGCRIKRLTDTAVFEIIGEPENVEMRNMFSVFQVRRVRGGA